MKKFFTNLSKCFSALAITVTVLASAFSASAEEYKSMIRYDRVWECYCDGQGPGLVVKCMKFAGTEEINGKEYHKIETFRTTFPKYNQATQTFNYDEYVDGLTQHEGYLREEDGVVYTLVVSYAHDLQENDLIGPLYIPGKYEPQGDEKIVEIPVYDFTRKQGEIYTGMSFCMGEAHSSPFTVTRIENIDIDGESSRKYYLLSEGMIESEYFSGHEVVESVGAIEYGCLNYHELVERPTMIWSQNYFNRLLDMNGNPVYTRNYTPLEIPYESFQTPDGVEGVEVSEANAPIYDILGRRLTNPTPGQLYIQAGKKHIAK